MSNGWEHSAGPWIAKMGERGDWGREYVLDPVMLERVSARQFTCVLDVGCGEGRFCRMLKARHISVVGIDPTQALLAQSSARCTQCGGKGATIQVPGWGGLQTPVRGWPS